jgi:hypothetical protein
VPVNAENTFLLFKERRPFKLKKRISIGTMANGELRWRGANSISKFDHHNINGGAVDNT